MTALRWIDRDGVEHMLSSCAPIEAEYRSFATQLLALRERLMSEDPTTYLAARRVAMPLHRRLDMLSRDLEAWDKACEGEIRTLAATARDTIGGIIVEARHLHMLHACYKQYADAVAAGGVRSKDLPSREQVTVLQEQAVRDNTYFTAPSSFAQAHSALIDNPATCRAPLPHLQPTFEWADRHGHHHQLRSPLPIEEEYMALADTVSALLPATYPEIALRDCAVALEKIHLAVERIQILEQTMHNWSAFALKIDRGTFMEALDALEKINGIDP